ncbi:MAG: cysteine synthase A [Candidatus Peregrinibacteria bacterium]
MNTSSLSTIGNTPLTHLETFAPTHNLFAKIESRNPLGSVKDRAAMGMITRGESLGLLKPGGTIIEATSGNTGIGLAWIALKKGYKLIVAMPENASEERKRVLKFLGADIVLTEMAKGMKGAVAKAIEIAEETGAYFSNQFENPGNPDFHYHTTGPEIWEQSGGKVDIIVFGVGTGGSIMGAGKFLREKNPNLQIIAVEPAESPVLSKGPEAAGPHAIPGLGAGFIPKIVDLTLFDSVETVASPDARATAREIAKTEGLFVGTSSGAAAFAARKVAAENPEKFVATLFPDTAERYCSTPLFTEIL